VCAHARVSFTRALVCTSRRSFSYQIDVHLRALFETERAPIGVNNDPHEKKRDIVNLCVCVCVCVCISMYPARYEKEQS